MSNQLNAAWIDHIPVIWLEPTTPQPTRRLAIFLTGLSGKKESVEPYLADLAGAGFVALSLDCWEHGERTALTSDQVAARTFHNFRRYMWVNIGQTALDIIRVIDWAAANLGVEPQVCLGGLSMGGDISVTAAGIDHRIFRVGAVGATPDWLRPGMVDLFKPDHPLLPPGAPDSYSRFFYEHFNPLTHLSHYSHGPEIYFINGEADDHVPPEASMRFKTAMGELYPDAAEKITIDLLPGQDHGGVFQAGPQWWPGLLAWFARPVIPA